MGRTNCERLDCGLAVVVDGWIDADVIAFLPAADVGEVAATDAVRPVPARSRERCPVIAMARRHSVGSGPTRRLTGL